MKSKKKKIGGGVATVGKVGEGVDRKRPVTLAHLGKAEHCYKNCLLLNKSQFTLGQGSQTQTAMRAALG